MEAVEAAAQTTAQAGQTAQAAATAPSGPAGAGWAASAESARTRLRTLFAEALQVPEADVDPAADFFALGGHSVSAGRIVGAVRKETGVRVGLVAFFEDPTVQGLADVVVAGAAGADGR